MLFFFVFFLSGLTTARVGYQSTLPSSTFEEFDIVGTYTHPSYVSTTGSYDVMVVKLGGSSTAQWARVNADPAFPPTSSAYQIEAVGIGQTSLASGLPANLQFSSLLAISPPACLALIRTGNSTGAYKTQIPDHQCFTDYRDFGGQCFYDEGGPLVEVGRTVTDDILVAVMAR